MVVVMVVLVVLHGAKKARKCEATRVKRGEELAGGCWDVISLDVLDCLG